MVLLLRPWRRRSYAIHFKEHTDRLKLEISDKSAAVPLNTTTKSLAIILSKPFGIPMKASKQGVDIGIDTSSAHESYSQTDSENCQDQEESGPK